MHSLKTLFDIGKEQEGGSHHTLLVEVGKDYCCTALFNPSANTIDRITYTSYNEFNMGSEIELLLQPLAERSFHSVVVCSAFSQALLVPTKYSRQGESLLPLMYPQPAQKIFHDAIAEWQMVTVFAVPTVVSESLQKTFSTIEYCHTYAASIKTLNGFIGENHLTVHFTEQQFRVILKKGVDIHLAQTYTYKTPLDVIYYLLKVCTEFELPQEAVVLIVSGMIEKESALFTELNQYFSQLHFAAPPQVQLPDSPYPHSFFTSIYNLAACVS